MSRDWFARDSIGNKLAMGDLVVFASPTPIVWKIVSVAEGGLMTPQGQTPTKVRIVCDVTLGSLQGQPIAALVKSTSPASEQVITDAMGRLQT